MKERPGSWSVLIATMALSLAVVKWIGAKVYYLTTPLIFLIKFVTERYEREINAVGDWIQIRWMNFITFLRRKVVHGT